MSTRKFLLLYAGFTYPAYTSNDYPQLINESGATDFVIPTADDLNYCQPGDYILTDSWVDSIANSVFGTTVASDIATIKNQMKSRIAQINQFDSTLYSYTNYVNSAITIATNLLQRSNTCKVWFAFPQMLSNCTPAATRYNYYYMQYIYTPIKTKMIELGYWGRVEGFYFAQEEIPQWYTKFTETSVSSQFNNVVVQTIKYVSDLVRADSKKLLWIPYYFYSNNSAIGQIMMRIGNVINKTNFLDFAILQPMYYFNQNLTQVALTDIKYCVTNQKCQYTNNGATVGGSKTSSTEIRAHMEVDINITNRYQPYVTNYSTFITGSVKRPMGFYADDKNTLMSPNVFAKVKNFFNNGQ